MFLFCGIKFLIFLIVHCYYVYSMEVLKPSNNLLDMDIDDMININPSSLNHDPPRTSLADIDERLDKFEDMLHIIIGMLTQQKEEIKNLKLIINKKQKESSPLRHEQVPRNNDNSLSSELLTDEFVNLIPLDSVNKTTNSNSPTEKEDFEIFLNQDSVCSVASSMSETQHQPVARINGNSPTQSKLSKKTSFDGISRQDSVSSSLKTKNMDEVFQNICADIRLDKDETKKRNKELLNLLRNHLIPELKQDKLFEKLFEQIIGTGSFYEGLKVSKPDEFDLNVVMRLPNMPKKDKIYQEGTTIEVTNEGAPPGYVYIKDLKHMLDYMQDTTAPENKLIFEPMREWYNSFGYFLPGKFQSWFESLFSKFIDKKRSELQIKLKLKKPLTHKKSGPAFTLQMDTVSIDLVPVFAVKLDDKYTLKGFQPLPENIPQPWYLVPKRCDSDIKAWRFSAYMFEKKLIERKRNLKPVIKLTKKLRDQKEFVQLASYFIKCTAFIAMDEEKIDFDKPLNIVFMKFLNILQEKIEKNMIVHIWDRKFNLLDLIKEERRISIANGFKKIQNQIDSFLRLGDYDAISKLFGVTPEEE